MLMTGEERQERNHRTVTSCTEVLYVLNTYLNHVFLRGGEYPLHRLLLNVFRYTQYLNLYLIHHLT
jgi:hypothetical protein